MASGLRSPSGVCAGWFKAPLLLVVLLALVVGFASPAGADNPLKKKTPRPFAGRFVGEEISLELSYEGVKTEYTKPEYTGWLTVEGDRYSCYGDVKEGVLHGTFADEGETYTFTARLDGDRMTLESEGERYTLRRQGIGINPPDDQRPPERDVPNVPVPPSVPRPSPAPGGGPERAVGGVGIAFQETEDGWVVAQVMPGGPAARARLQSGGVLRAVDGDPVDGMSQEDLRRKLQGPVGSTVRLMIETEDEETTVILERAVLSGGAGGGTPPAPLPGANRPEEGTPGDAAPGNGAPKEVAPEGGVRLKPGVRLIWYVSSASIPGSRMQLVPDEDGNWVDSQTGKRFSESEIRGGGGAGYAVIDLVSVTPERIVVDGSTWTIDVTNQNAPFFVDATGYVGDANGVGEYWVSPKKLAAIEESRTGAVRIRRVQYPLGGTTWNALRIQTQVANGWTQYTYDLDSGLLLVSGSNSVGAPVMTPGTGSTAAPGQGGTSITHGHLVSVRETRLPVGGAAFPDAVRRVRRWTYAGQQHTQMQGMGDIQVPAQPVTLTFDVVKADPSFLHAQVRGLQHQQMPALPPGERVVAPGVVGSLWMDPRVLAGFRPDQVLDEDPTLQARLSVAAVERDGNQGGRVVFVRQALTGSQAWAYDLASGVLTAAESRLQNGLALITLSVQLAGRD